MKKIHFFKAYSRIGIKNIPIHQAKLNLGVELGPDAILTDNFLQEFKNFKISKFNFSKPETLNKEKFYKILAEEIKKFSHQIANSIKPDEIQVVIGGDHCISLPSKLAVIMKKNIQIGHIHFDSHGDINLAKDSPTDNFHGMYMRPLFDQFDIPEIEELSPQKTPYKNLLYIGNLDLDEKEKELFEKNKIMNINSTSLRTEKSKNISIFNNFIKRFEHLHVSFDIDCLDRSIAAATGIPAENGLQIEDVHELLTLISSHNSFSLDLAEVNPQKVKSEKTVNTAQKILSIILKR